MENIWLNIQNFFEYLGDLINENIWLNIQNFFAYWGDLIFGEERYLVLINGLVTTVFLALFATIIGTAIGLIIAVVKYFCSDSKKILPKTIEKLCNVYITIIRGTPVLVQLLILSLIILRDFNNGFIVAVIGFGLNSGAYVAEIIRAGISAVDIGQTEAGRSLGFGKLATMRYIIMPQAIKNILPALGNEFIVLLKETSIAGFLAVVELTGSGKLITSIVYNSDIYLVVALMYLILVMGMTKILRIFERRMAKSDRSH